MNLRGLFMAMTMLKIKDNQVNLSIAGMPSALIYHRENNRVEEIAIRTMPPRGWHCLAPAGTHKPQCTIRSATIDLIMLHHF